MALSKRGSVMRALVEDMLKRDRPSHPVYRESGDLKLGLEVLKLLVDGKQVIILADVARFAQDFVDVTGIKAQYVWSLDCLAGLRDVHVISLHTGPKTHIQRTRYFELTTALKIHCEAEFYHIGEWR